MAREFPRSVRPETVSMDSLSVLLIGPDEVPRKSVAGAFELQKATVSREFPSYPDFERLLDLTGLDCDVVAIDLDADPELALDLVERICGQRGAPTVMVYSGKEDPDLLVRCMRAGARDLLVLPVLPGALVEALIRASARRADAVRPKKTGGKLLVFVGSKGGAGTTTLATNFAISLKRESGAEVALADLDVRLGDTAVILGLSPRFTLADALRNPQRLDREFVAALLAQHDSGISVLAAADDYTAGLPADESGLRRLIQLLREGFSYVIADVGPSLGKHADMLFEMAAAVYLVTQVEVPALRNAHRLLSHLGRSGGPRVEVVANRFDPRRSDIGEDQIAKVLGVPVNWRVPNDYAVVRRARNTGAPLGSSETGVSGAIRRMALAACDKPAGKNGKKRFGLFG